MKNLDRWILAYQTMDQRRREENLDLAEADAKAHPDRKPASLRLVSNGVRADELRDTLRGSQDFIPSLAVSAVCERKKLQVICIDPN